MAKNQNTKKMVALNAVIYARFSSDNQREESIEGQLRECKAFAEKNGYRIVGTYIDRALSARTDKRPDFQKMIKESAKGLFDTIIVWKLDRFARNRYDSAHYKHTLKKNNVRVISATEHIEDSSTGILMESVLEGFAEYYSAELSEKVIRGLTENALKAKANGGYPCLGLKVNEERCYVIDPLTAPYVQAVFQLYADGGTIKQARDFLNNKGIRNHRKKEFTYTSVSNMLKNRKYIGEYKYRDIVIPNVIPQIISNELFEKVQNRMKTNAKAPARHKAEDDYILTTKLICGHCGAFMVGEAGTSRNKTVHHYYKCVSAKKKKGCKKKTVKKSYIEDLVLKKCIEIITDDERIGFIADEVLRYHNQDNNDVAILEKQIKETEKSIDNIVSAIEQGVFTKSVKERLNSLENSLEELKIKLLQAQIEKEVLTKDMIVFYLSQFRTLDYNKLENKQTLVDNLVNKVILYDDKLIIFFNHNENQSTIDLNDINGSDLAPLGAPVESLDTRFAESGFF